MNTVQVGWLSYLQNVIPQDAGDLQISESRRAFYAGAAHVLGIAFKIGDDSISEEAGCKMLALLSDEIESFYREVSRGRA